MQFMKLSTINTSRFWFITTLILGVALLRFISIPIHNFQPIGAIALFGAATFRSKYFGFLVPLMALLLTDLALEIVTIEGFYAWRLVDYLAFAAVGCIGLMIRNNIKFSTVFGGAIAGSVAFFLISNFGAWLSTGLYPINLFGLMQSYAAGLAFYNNDLLANFFLNSMAADLFYSGLLFGIFYLAQKQVPQLRLVKA